MSLKTGYKCIIALLGLLELSSAIVDLKGIWKPNYGWDITCSWNLPMNDSLMFVRLYRNGRQYMVFRPRAQLYEPMQMKSGIEERSQEFNLKVICVLTSSQGHTGRCVTSMELYLPPPTPDVYRCEISGEAPSFLEGAADFFATVLPSKPEVSRGQRIGADEPSNVLNCTASGIPPPKLIWSTDDGHKIPRDFANTTWNPVTKLWHSWSTLNLQEKTLVTCSAVMSNGKTLETVMDAFNSAFCFGTSNNLIFIVLLLASWLR